MKLRLKTKKGSALLFTIFSATFIMFITVILMNLYMNEMRIKNVSEEKMKCKYIAEAGIEHGIGEITRILSDNLSLNSTSIESLIDSQNKFSRDIETYQGSIGNSDRISGDYAINFYEANNNPITKIIFEGVNIVPLSKVPIYTIKHITPLELIITSEGELKNSAGDILKKMTIEAKVKFQVDYGEKKVTKVLILDWKEKL